MSTFGTRLRSFRDAHGWSQEHLGFELEVSKATVSKWETGRAEPALRHLVKLRELYARDGLTLDYLITGAYADRPETGRRVNESKARAYERTADETAIVMRYRALTPARRKGLLAFLTE